MPAVPFRVLRRPPPLAPGARVALVAPAGQLRGPADVERAAANARALGLEPTVGAHALRQAGYLAGGDDERLADLNAALGDRRVDAVWCLRGGYGTMRLLDGIDYGALARRPKAIVGFSDVTALHAAIGVRCGLAGYHGPVARGALPPFSRDSLRRALAHDGDPCGDAPDARTIRGGRAAGTLAGGNLALLAALVGTPYAPDLRGTILVLEDVHEPTYRIDRMLRQLLLSGLLREVRGLVCGHFTEGPDEGDATRPLDDVLAEIADALRVPCIAGAPIGHVDEQWTVPLGALATLDADGRRLTVHDPGRASPDPFVASTASTLIAETPMAHKTGADLINEAKGRVREISPQEAQGKLGGDAVFLDVREPNEWNLGHVPGAAHVPRGMLESKIEQQLPRDREIVVYCAAGNRSALAADTLQQMGYANVTSLAGGWRDWVQSGGAVEG